jgi:hypothetical protein
MADEQPEEKPGLPFGKYYRIIAIRFADSYRSLDSATWSGKFNGKIARSPVGEW